MSETASIILGIIQENVPGIEFNPGSDGDRALTQAGIDSLDKMSILLAVQEKWNLEFTEEEIAGLNTFNDICRKVGG